MLSFVSNMFFNRLTKIRFQGNNALCVLAISCCVFAGCRHLPGVKQLEIEREKRATVEAEETIKNSPEWAEIDKVCSDIPKPESFQLISKRKSFSQRKYLTYAYYSSDAFEKMKPFYIDYFGNNGWKSWGDTYGLTTDGIKFRKDGFEASVYYSTRDEGVNYIFDCEKLE